MRNVTDVDDDILRKARELGVHYLDLAAEEMARFDADMAALGLLPVYCEPRATSAIPDILSLVGAALDAGHAYEPGGAVYFDVLVVLPLRPGQPLLSRPRCWSWRPSTAATPTTRTSATRSTSCCGSLRCPMSRRGSRAGARAGRVGTSSARRWPCASSATTVDLHGGGRDLVFPHHECETAQSESVTGTTFVRHWLHVGLVGLSGTKMSKSLGNLVFVGDLLQGVGARWPSAWPCWATTTAATGTGTDADLPAARRSPRRGGGRPAGRSTRRPASRPRATSGDSISTTISMSPRRPVAIDDTAGPWRPGGARGEAAALLGVTL